MPNLTPSTAARLLGQPAVFRQLHPSAAVLNSALECVYAHGELAGLRDDALLGTNFLRVFPVESRGALSEACARAMAQRISSAIDCAQQDQLLTLQLIPMQDDEGGALLLVVPTLASGTASSVRDEDRSLRYAVQASGVGAWNWDRVTDSLAWDEGLCRIYGLAPGQSPRLYEDYVRYLHPEDRPRIEAHLARCMETGVYEDFEHRLIRPDGAVRQVFCRGVAEMNAQGEVVAMRGGIFDITERKQLEERLYHAQRLEAFGQLAAGIAHNFNNLLSVVLSNAELCRRRSPASMDVALADIEHAATRAGEMVRNLMLFARHEGSEAKVAVDLTAVAQRTLGICRSTFDRRIAIEVSIEDELPPVRACAGDIEQVLLNVCINARDALEAASIHAPRIALRLARSGNPQMVRLTVADNGPGMDERIRNRIFEPFFTTKEIGRGTGLGLASAHSIVLDHGGSLVCQSAPGQGAVFILELPIADEPVLPAPPPPLREGRGGEETVLLVDDEPLVRRALTALLRDAGYQVLEASDGLHAFAVLEQAPSPQLILLDRSMPNMDGDEFMAGLRTRRPDLPVILLTGHPDAEPEGYFAVLSKPPRRELLLRTIRQALDPAKPGPLRRHQ